MLHVAQLMLLQTAAEVSASWARGSRAAALASASTDAATSRLLVVEPVLAVGAATKAAAAAYTPACTQRARSLWQRAQSRLHTRLPVGLRAAVAS